MNARAARQIRAEMGTLEARPHDLLDLVEREALAADLSVGGFCVRSTLSTVPDTSVEIATALPLASLAVIDIV